MPGQHHFFFTKLLELDLDKIASVRARISDKSSAMDYLLSTVRRELEQRIENSGQQFESIFVVDFKNSDFSPKSADVRYRSLLEPQQSGDNLFPEIENHSIECMAVNLQTSWLDFQQMITNANRVLKPGGSLFYSVFGPDTLSEVYHGWLENDEMIHVHPFVDMHYLGDAMLKAGFTKPIVDTDWTSVRYQDVETLFADLKQEGFTNIFSNRRKSLTGKNRMKNFKTSLNNIARNGEEIQITFEIVYGFAQASQHSDGTIRVDAPILD